MAGRAGLGRAEVRTAGPKTGGAEAAGPRGTRVPAAQGVLGAFWLPESNGVARPQ